MMRGAPGFGYGFVLAWAFVLSFFNLMCGLILEGFKDVIKAELEKREQPQHAALAVVSRKLPPQRCLYVRIPSRARQQPSDPGAYESQQ